MKVGQGIQQELETFSVKKTALEELLQEHKKVGITAPGTSKFSWLYRSTGTANLYYWEQNITGSDCSGYE